MNTEKKQEMFIFLILTHERSVLEGSCSPCNYGITV